MHSDWQSEIMRYCEENSSAEPDSLRELVKFSWLHTINPRQLSGHLQGRFLSMISHLMRPHCILEIGTFTGYAAHALAEGLAKEGMLHTIEADEEMAFKAKQMAQQLPHPEKIEFYVGRAAEIIPSLAIQPEIIFVDADKQGYQSYLELCLPLLADNGVMLFDNTLWSGKVTHAAEREKDADTAAMHTFNQKLAVNSALDVVILPLRDGLTMVRKRS